LTHTARWTPKSETIATNATNSYSLECPTTLTCSDRAPWPRRSSHPTTSRTQNKSQTVSKKVGEARQN
jgi:hypothetical protein